MRKLRLFVLAFASVIFAATLAAPEAGAADLKFHKAHRLAKKRVIRTAYLGCRTGWWRVYCDGEYRPRWGARCD